MKNKLFCISTFFILILTSISSFALNIPKEPLNYINDYAHLLKTDTVTALNQTLNKFEKETSNQIVVAIFPSLEQENLEDFSIKLQEQWMIGQKGKNNGVLLIIFVKEHKMRIEVGYGLEGAIPDAVAGNIIDTRIAPYFKQGKFDDGVMQAVAALMQASQHEYKAEKKQDETISDLEIAAFVLLLGFFIGRIIGPVLSLIIVVTMLGLNGLIGWVIAFVIYLIIYHMTPNKYRFSHPLGFFAGGFNNVNFTKNQNINDTDNSSNNDGGFSGGGGRSGGGGASGGW